MAVLQSQLRLTLLDQVTGRARGIMGTLNRLRAAGRAQAGMFAGLGGRLAMLTGGAASIYGVSRAFTSSLQVAGDFEAAMNRLRVVSGATGAQFDAMRKQALDLGRTTMFTASQTADAQNFLAMAGLDANQVLGAMPDTLNIAAASGMELAATADLVSNVMQQWGKEAAELTHVNDVMVTTFQNSNTNLAQLGEAMSFLAPVANMMGMEFEEMTAAVGLLGNAGIQGSRAGTGLQQALNKLVNPTSNASGLLREFGVNVKDSDGNVRDFADIMEDFEGAFGDVAGSVLDASGNMLEHEEAVEALMGTGEKGAAIFEIFGQRAGPAFAALLSQGSRKLREFTREVRSNEGATKRAADVMMTGWRGATREFWSAWEGVQIAWGSRATSMFEGPLRGLTQWLGSVSDLLDSLDRRVSIFKRMGTGARAFFQGLGFQDAGSAMAALRQFAVDGIFGSANPAQMVKDTEDMGRAWVKMRRIGEDVRSFIDNVSVGNLRQAMSSLWDAFSDLPGMGQVLTVFVAGKAFGVLAAGLMVLSRSPLVRLLAVAWTISTLIDAIKGAESVSDFIDELGKLEAFDWILIGGGIAIITGKILALTGAIKALTAAGGAAAAVKGGATAAAGAGAAAGGGALAAAGKWGSRLLRGGGLAGLLYGGWQASRGVGELVDSTLSGRHYTGKNDADLADMRARESALEAEIAAIRDRGGFFPELTENEIAPLAEQLNLLRQRIEATRQEFEHQSFMDSGPKHPAAMMPFLLENPATAVPDPSGDLQDIRAAIQESSANTQKVNEQNPIPVHAPISVTVYATTNADPNAIGRAVGDRVRDVVEGAHQD